MAQKASAILVPSTAFRRAHLAFNTDVSEIWQILDYTRISSFNLHNSIFGESLSQYYEKQTLSADTSAASQLTTRDDQKGVGEATSLNTEPDPDHLETSWSPIMSDP